MSTYIRESSEHPVCTFFLHASRICTYADHASRFFYFFSILFFIKRSSRDPIISLFSIPPAPPTKSFVFDNEFFHENINGDAVPFVNMLRLMIRYLPTYDKP